MKCPPRGLLRPILRPAYVPPTFRMVVGKVRFGTFWGVAVALAIAAIAVAAAVVAVAVAVAAAATVAVAVAAAAPASNRPANVCLRSPTYRPYVPLRSACACSVFKNHEGKALSWHLTKQKKKLPYVPIYFNRFPPLMP